MRCIILINFELSRIKVFQLCFNDVLMHGNSRPTQNRIKFWNEWQFSPIICKSFVKSQLWVEQKKYDTEKLVKL